MRIRVKLITGLSGPVSTPLSKKVHLAGRASVPATPLKTRSMLDADSSPFSGHWLHPLACASELQEVASADEV